MLKLIQLPSTAISRCRRTIPISNLSLKKPTLVSKSFDKKNRKMYIKKFTNADVIEEEADELGGGGCMSDGRFDDELTFDGCVGDELSMEKHLNILRNQ